MTDSTFESAETSSLLKKTLVEARRAFIPVGVFSFFFNLLMLVSSIYMMQVFDRVLTSGRTETLFVLTAIAIVALVVLGQMDTFRQRILTRLGIWLDRSLSLPILSASMKLSQEGNNVGAQPLRDLAQVRSYISGQGILPIIDAPWVPVFLIIIWILHPALGLFATFGAGVLFTLAYLNEKLTRKPLAAANEAQVTAFQHADKTVQHSEVVQAMGMLPNLLIRWSKANNKVLRHQTASGDRSAELAGATKFIRLALQIGVLAIGAYLVLQNQLTSGGMIGASILLGRGLAPIEQAIGAWRGFTSARSSYQRLNNILKTVPEEGKRMALSAPTGRLTAESATFLAPRGRKPILTNISFALEPGEAMAIVGPSASGKSSLCRLMVGVWCPTAGTVRLDGAEVAQWDRVDFGRYVGYLPQSVDLFDGTVAENIARMGEPESERVIKAAQLAGVHELILRLPDGYDTQIRDGGVTLSGGQRQRIGLARALFGDPCLLVLDEPNSNLDQEGEAALMRTVDLLRQKGTTIIMVAHRSSIVSHVDKLMVLIEGKVQMFGPAEEVIKKLSAKRVEGGAREYA